MQSLCWWTGNLLEDDSHSNRTTWPIRCIESIESGSNLCRSVSSRSWRDPLKRRLTLVYEVGWFGNHPDFHDSYRAAFTETYLFSPSLEWRQANDSHRLRHLSIPANSFLLEKSATTLVTAHAPRLLNSSESSINTSEKTSFATAFEAQAISRLTISSPPWDWLRHLEKFRDPSCHLQNMPYQHLNFRLPGPFVNDLLNFILISHWSEL